MTAVSVVIPCFNDGVTLPDAVDSVRAQEHPFELVVVDDGSTDPATVDVFMALERDGVRVVHQPNAGLSAARMAGVRATTAPYVLPLDADDRLAGGALALLAAALDHDPEAAAAWGWYQRFGRASYVQRTAHALDPWQVTYQNDLPATALFRRQALLAAGGWQLHGGYEDWDLWMALAERRSRGISVPAVTYYYRLSGGRMLEDAAARHVDITAVLRRRHSRLFADRRGNWRRSLAPLALRLTLPAIAGLPVSPTTKRLLSGVACHLAYRRGIRTLARRLRAGG